MLPTIEVKVGEPLVDVIVRLGFATSKREARYFITHGAVRLRRWKKKEMTTEEVMDEAVEIYGEALERLAKK